MKIAILIPNYSEYSGDARVAELRAETLVNQGNEVTIFALGGTIKIKNKINIKLLGMPKNLFFERIYRLIFPIDILKIHSTLKMLKSFDLIESHNYPMNILGCLAKVLYHKKYGFWYYGVPTPELFPYLYERIYLKLFILFTKLTVQNVDYTISISNAARLEFKKYTGLDSKIEYSIANLDRFEKAANGQSIRSLYKLGNDPVILNVGRISPHKGTQTLVQAFDLIKEKIPNVKLIIVGKPTYEYYYNQLKEMSDGSVIFAGYVPDIELPKYYAMCDIYATCSLWELYDLPIVEAQKYGKPAVAFNIGSHPEVINNDGILIEKGNIKLFAEACINKLLKNEGHSYDA